jgi:hypothetical protein
MIGSFQITVRKAMQVLALADSERDKVIDELNRQHVSYEL